jgi:flavin prenyltransferase
MEQGREIVLGVSGASGAVLATGFLRLLAGREDVERIHLVVSPSARRVAADELGWKGESEAEYLQCLAGSDRDKVVLHADEDIAAPIASGSYPTDGMVVMPCSAGTLASIAHGISRGLLQRAADVTLKERRPLVLSFREAPYSLIHLDNMRTATMAGAMVMPPSLPFYIPSPTLDRLLDAYFHRVARVIGLAVSAEYRWTGPRVR